MTFIDFGKNFRTERLLISQIFSSIVNDEFLQRRTLAIFQHRYILSVFLQIITAFFTQLKRKEIYKKTARKSLILWRNLPHSTFIIFPDIFHTDVYSKQNVSFIPINLEILMSPTRVYRRTFKKIEFEIFKRKTLMESTHVISAAATNLLKNPMK